MYEYPEEQQDDRLIGPPGAGQRRLQQYLSQVGSPAERYRQAARQQQGQQGGGLTGWLVNKLKGPLPELPAPPKPPGPPNGAVGSPQFELVRAQDAARNDPKNQPDGKGKTYCNIATYRIAQAMGVPLDPFITQVAVSKMYPKGTRPAMANEIVDNLARSKDYRVITADEAQSLANHGHLVVAVQPHQRNGHVATVRPDNLYNETAPTVGRGPVMNHIGNSVAVRRASGAFYSDSEPIYYTPVGSK